MSRKDKHDGFWWEDDHNVPRTRTGRAGKGPRARERDSPESGWGLGFGRRGPTRGMSRTGHDRKGGWLFGRGR